MKKTTILIAFLVIVFAGYFTFFLKDKSYSNEKLNNRVSEVKNSEFIIEGEPFKLTDGYSEKKILPESATKIITQIFDEPIFGDLDEDGDDDALVFLIHNPGGSGTFFYVAGVINENGKYRGTNAILLGDRISPQNLNIKNGIVIANYADRQADEPMTALPSVGKSNYSILENGSLKEINLLEEGESVLYGYFTYGDEAITFRNCGEGNSEYWVMDNSPALNRLKEIYGNLVLNVESSKFIPLFVVVSGKIINTPSEGFGADYDYAIEINQLIKASRQESCRSNLIIIDEPLSNSSISSPLTFRGKARGTWFFEGDFSVILTDWDGKIIAEGYASSKGNWMTEDFVNFEGTLQFDKPDYGEKGSLIFKKDNPSDLPENDDALEMTVFFK